MAEALANAHARAVHAEAAEAAEFRKTLNTRFDMLKCLAYCALWSGGDGGAAPVLFFLPALRPAGLRAPRKNCKMCWQERGQRPDHASAPVRANRKPQKGSVEPWAEAVGCGCCCLAAMAEAMRH